MKIKLTHFPLYTAAITLLVTVIVIWTYNIKLNSQYFIEQQTKLEEFHIKKNVQALKTLLQSQQFDEVKRLVSEISVSQYISHIHVFSSDFVFVASNKISNEGKLLLDVDSNLFHRLEQVTRNQFPQNSKQELFRKLDVYTSSLDKKIYYLYLDFELLSIYDTFQKQTVNSIILFTICITVIALFFYLASKSTLKRRIKKLQRTIVSYYDGNNSVRYNPKKNSDFIELELLLNAMFDLVEHEQQLMQEEKAFSNTVLSSTTDGIIVIDDKGQIVLVNQQALSIFKYENQEELIGKNVLCLVPSEFHLMHVEIFEKQKHNTPQTHGILNKIRDISGVTKDGESFPISITVATNIQQGKRYYSAFVKDLTQTQQYERSIESLAYFDELTGLFNINGIIRHTEVREQKATLCLIELNHTRTINEAYGYEFGDVYIKSFANMLLALGLKKQIVARGTGCRFILLSYSEQTEVEQKLAELLLNEVDYKGIKAQYTYHCAITQITENNSLNKFLKLCRIAIRNISEDSHDTFIDVDLNWINKEKDKARLQQKLSDAIKNDELFFEFQPKFTSLNKELASAEALIRWSENGKRISPGIFIPIAENSSLMPQIDKYVIENTCKTIRQWLDLDYTPVPIAINLSSKYLFLDSTISFIFEKLGEYNVPGELIEIEVTEYGLIKDFSKTAENMEKLQGAGISVAIDDFGTGHSNLEAVQALPIQNLKIDQAFIKKALLSDKSKAILENIVQLASSLNIKITAEGVETDEQLAFIKQLGCDYVQGFLLAKPMSLPVFEALFSSAKPFSIVSN